jgi:hypothetical protein
VVVITTKSGKKGKISVTVYNNTTFESVAYLPEYQNEYGQGGSWGDADFSTFDYNSGIFGGLAPYPTEWASLDGGRYMATEYVDESWGPKLDGGDYIPWYAWWPGDAANPNPYYGKTQKYTAQENNIKDFYDTGVTTKTGFSVSGGSETGTGILSYSRTDQTGILPNSELTNDQVSARFRFNLSDALTIGVNATYNRRAWAGNFADTYGTGTSGNFNQWFGRNLDVNRMRELKDLKTLNGHSASWNWWGPDLYGYGEYFPENSSNGDFTKATFWFNPYYMVDLDKKERTRDRLSGSINLGYKINDHLKADVSVSTSSYDYNYSWKIPYELQYNSAFYRYNDAYINSLSTNNQKLNIVEFSPSIAYDTDLNEDFNLNVILGGSTKSSKYTGTFTNMTTGSSNPYAAGATLGLVIPDLFDFSNSKEIIKPSLSESSYRNKDLFARTKINYKKFLIITGDISNVWSSTFDMTGQDNKNSFLFGSIGASFIFTDVFMKDNSILDYGKLRASYGTVGTFPSAQTINPTNFLGSNSYNGNPTMYAATTAAAAGIHPATSASYETGVELRMLDKKIKIDVNYFNEHRTDEILQTETSSTSGVRNILVNAGDIKRTGIELQLGLKVIQKKDFKWNMNLNWSNAKSTVIRLADGQTRQVIGSRSLDHRSSFGVTDLINEPGKEWGQLTGNAIKRDAAGNPILYADGTYDFEADHNYGSVLPDFTGGLVNSVSYKGVTLAGTLSFQKGGKFFSLTEWWGTQTGLLNNTIGNNDLGNPVRDDVGAGGGVHVVGVDTGGAPVDTYVDAHTYYAQFYSQRIAEPFVHEASYIKLADLSLSYKFPSSILGKSLQSASVGIIARNLGMIATSKDNTHNWDPSELTYAWGEDAGLPGTRSIGFNISLTF